MRLAQEIITQMAQLHALLALISAWKLITSLATAPNVSQGTELVRLETASIALITNGAMEPPLVSIALKESVVLVA